MHKLLALILFLATWLSVMPAMAQSSIWGNVASPSPSEPKSSSSSMTTTPRISSHTSDYPRLFFGGGLSLGFGDVEYYDIQPMLGVQISRQFSSGVSFLYRYRKDTRISPSLSTEDFGGTLFARYHVVPQVFLQGEYEYLNYEYYRADLTTARDDFSSFLAGAGIAQPLGRNGTAYASALYNFSYDATKSPYDSPWVYRLGVSFGF